MTPTQTGRSVAEIIVAIDAANVPTEYASDLFNYRQAALADLGVELADAVRPRQSEIDARETARVEALLQLCRWLTLPEDPLDPHDTAAPHVSIACAIQHDLIDDLMRRQAVVTTALDILADRWEALPDGERDVVLFGILGREDNWDYFLYLVEKSATVHLYDRRGKPEARTAAERDYARRLQALVRQVIGV